MAAFRREEPIAGEELLAHALRMLGRRELSRQQLRTRLLERCPDAGAVEATLTHLAERGLVDDRRVAAAYARTACQVKRRGRDRVLRELAEMGVSGEIAAEAVAEACGPETEAAALDVALARRARGLDLTDQASIRRVFGALLRQGFDGEAIRRALSRARAAARDDV